MKRRIFWFLATVCVLSFLPLVGLAQQQAPSTFIYVSDWTIPRAHWEEYEAFSKKNAQPVFERLLADGTIISWGFLSTLVHQEDGYTHTNWYEATSMANLEKTAAELRKLPPNPIVNAGVKHQDLLLRTSLRRTRPGSGTNGFLWVNWAQVQPGKGQQWRELFEKYNKPVYDELLANGTITHYNLQERYVHTDNPNWRIVVYVTPNAEGIDKVRAAFDAAAQKRGPEANRAVAQAFAEVTVAGVHRDYAARVLSYGQK